LSKKRVFSFFLASPLVLVLIIGAYGARTAVHPLRMNGLNLESKQCSRKMIQVLPRFSLGEHGIIRKELGTYLRKKSMRLATYLDRSIQLGLVGGRRTTVAHGIMLTRPCLYIFALLV
jgi:hypothetical protein